MARFDFDEEASQAAASKRAEDARVAKIVADKQKVIDATPKAEKTTAQTEVYNNAKAIAQGFVTSYGGSLSDYFDVATGRVTAPKAGSKFITPNAGPGKYTGSGTSADPFSLDGKPFNGTYGGKKYVNGIAFTEVTPNGTPTGTPTGTPGQIYTAPDGRIFKDIESYNAYITKTKADEKARAGKSAYDILFSEFNRYGMGSLITPLQEFIIQGLSKDELTLKLRGTEQYKDRFRANEFRIKNGFAAIDEATYLGLEDKYQSIMQNYGLPESYYKRGALGKQAGFENLIGGNVDPITLEERIMEGQKVVNGSKDIKDAIGQFYPGINNSDFLAYVLDPKNALVEIKRKVTAGEIGGAAIGAGLTTNVTRAEELGAFGINRLQAQQGYATIGGGLERGSQLASIYGEDPYTQTTAESEIFNLSGQAEAKKERQKITGLEKATFGAKTGITSGALARDRAGGY